MAKKMLKSHHLAILALVLALGIATPIVVATLSEDEFARAANETAEDEPTASAGDTANTDNAVTGTTDTPTADAAVTTVGTFAELKAAIADAEQPTITLGADIELSEPLTISRDLTLDLKTYKITVAENTKGALIIRQGDVMITGGEGSSVTANYGVTIWVYGSKIDTDTDFTHLTVDHDVLIASSSTDDASYGIAINRFDDNTNSAYGVKVDFDGKISAYNGITILGHIRHANNAPLIHIGDSAVIDAQGEDDSMAIYAAGYGVWTVGAADLTGSSALGAKAGEFTFADTVMTANGSRQDAEAANGGIAGSGAVFQIENNSVYAGGIKITINDGEYTSENGHVFYEYGSVARAASNLEQLTINAGTFKAGPDGSIFGDVNAEAVTLNGGTYNKSIPATYLDTDQELVEQDGTWTLKDASDDNNQTGTDDPNTGDDNNTDNEQKPADKPQAKPDGGTPGTGAHNITSHISAIATTTTAAIVGVLVFCAFVLRRLIHRNPDQAEKSTPKSTSSAKSSSGTKTASKSQSSSRAKSSSAVKKAAKSTSKTAVRSTKAAPKSAKTTKSSAKSSAKKGTKTTKTRK